MATAPNIFPAGTGYGHNSPAPSPWLGGGGSASIPKPINDDFKGPVPEWAKKLPPSKSLGKVYGKIALPIALHSSWNEFDDKLGLSKFINGHPLLNYGYFWLGPNWTRTCYVGFNCGPGTDITSGTCGVGWYFGTFPTCTTSCAVPTTTVNRASINANAWNYQQMIHGYWRAATATLAYFRTKEAFQRVGGVDTNDMVPYHNLRPDPGVLPQPFPEPSSSPFPWAQPGTSPVPNVVPELQPVWQPGPLPMPLPYAVPRPLNLPGIEPAYQPQKWPKPAQKPQPSFSPKPGVEVWPEPGPGEGPVVEVVPVPSSGPRPGVSARPGGQAWPRPRNRPGQAPRHSNKPPPKGTTERKAKGPGAAQAAKQIINGVTEGLDALDAAWNAVGTANGWQTKVKGTRTSPQQKAIDVKNAFSDPEFNIPVFVAAFAKNLAINEAVDRGVGAVGKAQAQGAKHQFKASGGLGPHGDLPIGHTVGPAL